MTEFNPNHERVLAIGLLDIHRRLEEMEAFLARNSNSSPLSEHIHDISATEVKVVRDYFARMRRTLVACLEENDVPLTVRRTSLRWTLQVGIDFVRIAIAELGPRKLRGYGPLSVTARDRLIKIQQELERLADRVGTYLRQGLGQDLSQRLARLEASSGTVATLTLVNRIVSRWQLVEFRPLIDTILMRLERPQYEIAVFGRVNSGKSSLLNHVVGMDVLPVGVTPITAVPTRLVRGDRAVATIQFAERDAKRISVDELAQYASEEGNPANKKHVTGITVEIPPREKGTGPICAKHPPGRSGKLDLSPFPSRLPDGVVLVDTPGIGSLALAGGAETLAYLPRCDLGVLLIDAAAALSQDDLAVLRALYEAGIPAQVLVSKADLLTPADQDRTTAYVREQIQRELNVDLQVHPVSTVGSHEALLGRWFDREIEPLFQRHMALAEKSLQRKIAHLRESVVAVLETMASGCGGRVEARDSAADVRLAQQLLSQADSAILRTREQCENWSLGEAALTESIFQELAQGLVHASIASEEAASDHVVGIVRDALAQRTEVARQAVSELRQTLQQTLEAMQGIASVAGAEIAPIRDFFCSELPILVLSGLREKCHPVAPWWRKLLPRWAVPVLRRWLEKRLGPAIREFVKGYNDQLGIWLKDRVARLEDIYQSQADVLREQVRRITVNGTSGERADDEGELVRDLQELSSGGGRFTDEKVVC